MTETSCPRARKARPNVSVSNESAPMVAAICQRLGAPATEIPVSWRDVPGSTFSVSHHSAATLREVALIWLHYRPGRVRPGRARAARLPAPLSTGLAAEPFGPASVIVLPFTPPALLASSAALPAAVTTA